VWPGGVAVPPWSSDPDQDMRELDSLLSQVLATPAFSNTQKLPAVPRPSAATSQGQDWGGGGWKESWTHNLRYMP
jgi:hypothetical protein